MLHLFFSFQGRINRARYWFAEFLRLAAVFGLFVVVTAAAGRSWERVEFDDLPVPLQIIWCIAGSIWIYTGLALQAKRWHDRDKSGFWILINFVPYVGGLWAFVECGCMRGTVGSNRFGPDPLDDYRVPNTVADARAALPVHNRLGTM